MTAIPLPAVYDPQPRNAGVPWFTALVLCTLFAFASWTGPTPTWYGSSEGDVTDLVGRVADGQISRQISFILFGVYGLGLLLTPSSRSIRVKLRVMYPILLFCALAVCSVSWSIDRTQTAKRLVVFCGIVITVAGMLKHYDARQIAQFALITATSTVFIGIGNECRILLTAPPPAGTWRFGGMMHPNHTGLHCCVTMLACQYLYKLRRQKYLLVIFAIAAVALFETKSRTALMSTVTAVATFWMLTASYFRVAWLLLLATWLTAGGFWLSSMEVLPDWTGVVNMGRKDLAHQDITQLTGRTDIWKFALMQASKDRNREFLGSGYETFWTPENTRGVSEFVNFKISEGHNIYLDWYLELGFVGVSLWVLILMTALGRWTIAARTLQSPSAAVAASIILATLVHGFAESSLGDANLPTLFVYLSIAGSGLVRPDEEDLA